MATYSQQIEGSRLTLGVRDYERTTQISSGVYYGGTDDANCLKAAIAGAQISGLLAVSAYDNVPLQLVHAQPINNTDVLVTGVYHRNPKITASVNPAANLLRTYGGVWPVRWYLDGSLWDVSGLPDGELDTPDPSDPEREPRPWTWRAPVLHILVPTVLTYHPAKYCCDPANATSYLFQHVNNAAVTWMPGIIAGSGMAAGTLLFYDLDVQAFEGNGSTIYYRTNYHLIYNPAKWYQQRAYWNDLSGAWDVDNDPLFPTATFTLNVNSAANGFNVHA